MILFILSCTPPLPQEDDPQLSECNAPYGYDCGDISVLQKFIELNSSPEIFRHYMDYNENDILEPIEFGYQLWDRGRLIQLNLNYSTNVIMQEDNPTELDTTNYRLTKIPNSLSELTGLESLFLHDNELSDVPDNIGNLSQLKILDLENNLITEMPSSFGNLVNLERLVLSSNQITSLPESIGSLISLKKLWLQDNQLASLPGSLGDLIQLEWLYLNNNLLEELPDEMGNLINLNLLNIENNMISSIPESMCNEVNNNIAMYEGLETFSIGDNKFCDNNDDGTPEGIPACIEADYEHQSCANCDPWEFNIEGYCADSSDYNILQNFLDLNPESQSPQPLPAQTGIPKVASLCVNDDWWEEGRLVEITFQHKHLKSKIPENFGDLDKLEILRLTGNELTGGIPDNLMNLNNLKILKLNSNYIGCYYYGVGNDECLVHCNDTEQCSGTIPENIGLLTNLDTLWLNDNNLSGEIPPSITNLTGLGYLYLQENNLYGSIPYNIGDLNSLKYLSLDNNNFEGEIPQSIGNLTNLKRLYLYNNNLSGQLPESICTINNLTMYLHNNQLCPGDEGYPECFPAQQMNVQDTSNCP